MLDSISAVVKRLATRDFRLPRYLIALFVILLIALDLRVSAVVHTVIDTPVSADAHEYVTYAYNLKIYGVYSKTANLGKQTAPSPDAFRVPLYPMAIVPFLSKIPVLRDLRSLTLAQAILSTLTVLLVYGMARKIFSKPFALAAAALTALSPHLVSMATYALSETLFCFLAVSAVFIAMKAIEHPRPALTLIAGIVLALAALTHPMLLYLILPLAVFFAWTWRRHDNGWKMASVLILGFALMYAPWIGRNIATLGAVGDNTLMLAALRAGAYRNLMYRDDPKTYGYPYYHDPDYAKSSRSAGTTFDAIVESFREAPGKQIYWYMIGKPIELWSWRLPDGNSDIFIYPSLTTPYDYLPHFKLSKALMESLHYFLVALMMLGIVISWLPQRLLKISSETLLGVRLLSVVLLYHFAVMMAGFPLSRYAIPMRPFMYIMAMLPLMVATQWFATTRQPDKPENK